MKDKPYDVTYLVESWKREGNRLIFDETLCESPDKEVIDEEFNLLVSEPDYMYRLIEQKLLSEK